MANNIVKEKSFEFAVKIVKLVKSVQEEKKEFLLTKQLVRSGTSIGANIIEGSNAESKADFIHKLSIAQKECSETIYWLELLRETDYITESQFDNIKSDAAELMKLLTAILKTSKTKINH
ncbi:MAG: four helix bundle protein [Bacteroidales bacterium]|jgi:four helix bundle protein